MEQWELYENDPGKVDAVKVRSFNIDHRPEGCVADDELAFLYLGVEKIGIWKYGAEPEDGSRHTVIDTTSKQGPLHRQVEGLTIYYGKDRTGYLIASSQGADEFVIYRREHNNAYVGTFKIAGSEAIDKVSHTDGIDVTSHPLGSAFPKGVFVAQDHQNDTRHQNFKLVPWHAIARTLPGTTP